ncbi:hypothetical protein AOE01nite_11230 [Acetobacter oeni]|uniref:Uncharacterized protein n=1 Tax=Acetobacter oeni TaxID=304077 RepID=A0A511XIY5_9PROT|nr:hypothetical protein AOE01nite_11230 [Acetobacter oeni]
MLVRQHTAWLVLFFGWIGLAALGGRVVGMVAGALLILAVGAVSGTWLWLPVVASGRLALAVFADELIEWEMKVHGFTPDGVVAGPNAAAALLRYMDQTGRSTGTGAAPVSPTGHSGVPDPFAAAYGRPAGGTVF